MSPLTATIAADGARLPGLSHIRRLEAAAFRAWPAATTYYDGTWSIRLTPDHPSRRLNSVNPLDPSDHSALEERIDRAEARFRAVGRPLTFRQTPLASRELESYLEGDGFLREHESSVQAISLDNANFSEAMNQIPLKDVDRYAQASAFVHGEDSPGSEATAQVIGSIKAQNSLFVSEDRLGPVTTVICVQDGPLAGIVDLATRKDVRRKGHGAAALATALKWAKAHGASMAWLQVEAGNAAALALYRNIGFEEVYRYVYRVRRA